MSHRILLVAGTTVERGRLETSLRNNGVSALAADQATSAALLCRQFGPSVIVLLDNPTAPGGRQQVALLLNQPATAAIPVVAFDYSIPSVTAATLLRSLAGLLPPPNSGSDIVAGLNVLFGTDHRDLRRRLSYQRRGPVTLRRIGDHLRQIHATGVININDGDFNGAGGAVRLHQGHLEDARYQTMRGVAAIKTLLTSDDDQPWGITFQADSKAIDHPSPRDAVPAQRPASVRFDSPTTTTTTTTTTPDPVGSPARGSPIGPDNSHTQSHRVQPPPMSALSAAIAAAQAPIGAGPTSPARKTPSGPIPVVGALPGRVEPPPNPNRFAAPAPAGSLEANEVRPAAIAAFFDVPDSSNSTSMSDRAKSIAIDIEVVDALDVGSDPFAAFALKVGGLPPLPSRRPGEKVPLRVLLIDDDDALIKLYERTFSHAGHKVSTAHDGASGIIEAAKIRPDVVVSDIAMPNKSGWDVLAAIRSDPTLAETPVVLLSCHGDFLAGLARSAAGADDYIEKGIRAGVLIERVERAAAARARLLSWDDEPPPSFAERLSDVGLVALLHTLERTNARGEVRLDDGWVTIRLNVDNGELRSAVALEADGGRITGDAALALALSRQEADVEFIAAGDEARARTPSRRLTVGEPTTDLGAGGAKGLSEAILHAAFLVEDQQRRARERVLVGDSGLVFRDAAAATYFMVADEVSARIAQRFYEGMTPRALLAFGSEDQLVVESVVKDLIQKGVADLMA